MTYFRDVGGALALAGVGFPAIATSSAGLCYSLGRSDSLTALSVDDAVAHFAKVVDAVALPVSADFEAGYAADPEELGITVKRCMQSGVAGLSIEDATVLQRDRFTPVWVLSNGSAPVIGANCGPTGVGLRG